jgi:hypothetical protein
LRASEKNWKPLSGPAGRALLVVALLLAVQDGYCLAPMDTRGYLDYQLRYRTVEKEPDRIQNVITGQFDLSTYIWQPWIAAVNADLAVTRSYTDVVDDGGQDTSLVTGRGELRLLPVSPFPLALFVEQRDSDVSGTLLGTDFSFFSYGFMQQFAPSGGGRFSLSYRNDEVSNDTAAASRGERIDNSDLWQFSADKRFGAHALNLSLEQRSSDVRSEGLNENSDIDRQILRHRFTSGTGLSLDNVVFHLGETRRRPGQYTDRDFAQVNSILAWRPRSSSRLLVTSTALATHTESVFGLADTEANAASINAGATWQQTPRLSLAASGGASLLDTPSRDQTNTYQRVGANYTGDLLALGALSYNWGTGLAVANNTFSDDPEYDSIQDYTLRFDHGLSRSLGYSGGSQLSFNLGQQVAAGYDTLRGQGTLLNHTAALTWSAQTNQDTTFLRMALGDRRRYGIQEDVFQLVNLQASRRWQTSHLSSWTGNLTLQWTFSSAVMDWGQQGSDDASYSIDLNYNRMTVFGLPNLNFISELRYFSSDFRSEDDLTMTADTRLLKEDRVWRNRLEYRIGKLELKLHADLLDNNGSTRGLLLFQARRYF